MGGAPLLCLSLLERADDLGVLHVCHDECGLLVVEVGDLPALDASGSFKGSRFKRDPSELL